jgi:hypothetical protein
MFDASLKEQISHGDKKKSTHKYPSHPLDDEVLLINMYNDSMVSYELKELSDERAEMNKVNCD